MQNRIEVLFKEKVEPYDVGDTGYLTESMVKSLGDKVEIVKNKAILSPKSTK